MEYCIKRVQIIVWLLVSISDQIYNSLERGTVLQYARRIRLFISLIISRSI